MRVVWWPGSRTTSKYPCGRFSEAWASRHQKHRAASAARRRGFMRAIWITRNLSRERRCSFRCTRRARCSRLATVMRARENGEVDITALETALTGTFQFLVRKDLHLRWPRGETPTHYITMGLHEDLREATKLAVEEMFDFLVTEKHLTRDDAYMLTSVAADLSITQLVDGNKGVHAMIAKSIFRH